MWTFVRFETSDGIRLNGALAGGDAQRTVIHVHGKSGNFYENEFIDFIAATVTQRGWNFLTFNNRGTACLTEAYIGGHVGYIGGGVELFEDAEKDVAAAVQFAERYGAKVVLQGHSSGCDKIMYYALNSRSDLDLILLSASDSYALQTAYIFPESVAEQLDRLKELDDAHWLNERDYGIRVGNTYYPIPVTVRTLRDFMTGPAFDLLRLDKDPKDIGLRGRVLGLWGGADPLQIGGVERTVAGLRKRMPQLQAHVFHDADHQFRQYESDVAHRIAVWLEKGK